jgi:hypothetical protein
MSWQPEFLNENSICTLKKKTIIIKKQAQNVTIIKIKWLMPFE